MTTNPDLLDLTGQIVAAHVANNAVSISDVPTLIASTHAALAALGMAAAPIEPAKPVGAVSIRASLKPEALISMIDGRPYKMLRRHLSNHGFTPESYRAAYGLPASYPMVAPAYSEQRRTLAKSIGLGTMRRKRA